MRAVSSLGTINFISQKFLHLPPEPPKNPNVDIFFERAYFNTFKIFKEFPEVVMAIKISFLFASAWKGLKKISEKS